MTRDITAEREAERERRQLEEALRQSQKLESVGVLASGVAHEFRNLLQIIHAYVDLLRRAVAAGVGRRPLPSAARAAVERGADITARLLAFSRRPRSACSGSTLNDVVTGWPAPRAHLARGDPPRAAALPPSPFPSTATPGSSSRCC